MKRFLKTLSASCLGTILGLTLIVGVLAIYFSVVSKPDQSLSKASVLKLDLWQFIPEMTGNVEQEKFDFSANKKVGLNDLKKILRSAATDPMIKGIFIQSGYVNAGQATLKALRQELEEFKKSEKFIWSYADYYSQSAYWLSSVADSLFLNPNGSIELKGYGTAMSYYKEMMDKFGVEMNIFYAGKYKSATEPYRRSEMSEENKAQIKSFLNEMQLVMLTETAKSRNLTSNKLKVITSEYKGGFAEDCLNLGLVDELLYWNEFEKKLKSIADIKSKDDIPFISHEEYLPYIKETPSKAKDKIAIVYAEGNIVHGNDKLGNISQGKYQKIFNEIRKDKNIKSIVLRINSPGGNSLDSDNLNQEIIALKKEGLNITASLGDYAASGGYYIACNADKIVAEPNTLTGSIGVYIMFPNVSKLLTDKIGITFDTVKTDPFAIGFTNVMDLTSGEKKHLELYTDHLYMRFLKTVATGRKMNISEVAEIAQGRVWTGSKAVKNGLVDTLGGLEESIAIAAKSVGLSEYQIVEYPKIKKDPVKEIINKLVGGNVRIAQPSSIEKEFYQIYNQLSSYASETGPQARIPYFFYWN